MEFRGLKQQFGTLNSSEHKGQIVITRAADKEKSAGTSVLCSPRSKFIHRGLTCYVPHRSTYRERYSEIRFWKLCMNETWQSYNILHSNYTWKSLEKGYIQNTWTRSYQTWPNTQTSRFGKKLGRCRDSNHTLYTRVQKRVCCRCSAHHHQNSSTLALECGSGVDTSHHEQRRHHISQDPLVRLQTSASEVSASDNDL